MATKLKILKLSTQQYAHTPREAMGLLSCGCILQLNNNIYKLDTTTPYIKLLQSDINNYTGKWDNCNLGLQIVLNECSCNVYTEHDALWYENIPKEGVFCKVENDDNKFNEDSFEIFAVIVRFDPARQFPFCSENREFRYAKPVSLELLEKYVYAQI